MTDPAADSRLILLYQQTAGEVEPIFRLLDSSQDISSGQYALLDRHRRTSFVQLDEMLNVAQIHKLLEEGTK